MLNENLNTQTDDMLSQDSEKDRITKALLKERESFKLRPKEEIIEKAKATGTGLLTGTLAIPSDIATLSSAIASGVTKFADSPTAMMLKGVLQKAEKEVGREAFDKWFTKTTGIESNPENVDQLIGEIISPTGAFLAPVKTLKKVFAPLKKGVTDFFDNITPGGGGSGGAALETAGVGQLDETKKLLKDEQKAITTEAPITIPPDEFINAPKVDKMSMGGKNTPTGAEQIKKYKELDKTKKYNPDELFEMTGVYKGEDGKFRWEIDTIDAELKNVQTITDAKDGDAFFLSNLLKFDKLYQEYFKPIKVTRPSQVFKGQKSYYNYKPMKNLGVIIKKQSDDGALADYSPASDKITLYTGNILSKAINDQTKYVLSTGKALSLDDLYKFRLESTLLHEVQHAIQGREGFTRGSNTENFLRDGYSQDLKTNDALLNNSYNNLIDNFEAEGALPTIRDRDLLNKNVDRIKRAFDEKSLPLIDTSSLVDQVTNDLRRIPMPTTSMTKNVIKSYVQKVKQYHINKKALDDEYDVAYDKYRDTYGEREARLVQKRFERRLDLKAQREEAIKQGKTPSGDFLSIEKQMSAYEPIPKDMKGVTSAERDRLSKIARTDPVTGKVKPRIAIGKNKGGDIMKKQMELFDEGGLKDEGNTVDPVSGNDVPPGATQEEVRDDIPAQLSEGEFVFPADVVRYLGLEFLMKLRQKAKAGLQRMEDMGQMGNSDEATIPDDAPFNPSQDDLPFTMEDLDMEDEREYNEGGVVKAQTGTYVAPGMGTTTTPSQFQGQPLPSAGNVPNYVAPMIPPPAPAPVGGFRPILSGQTGQTDTQTPTPTFQSLLGRTPGQYDELREYVNEAGMKLRIPFKDGQPIYPIPEGYTFVDPEATKTEEVTTKEVTPQTTRVVEDTSSGDDDEDIKTGAVDLAGDPLSYKSIFNMDKLDTALKDIAFNQANLFDPKGAISRSIGDVKVNVNEAVLYAQKTDLESFKLDKTRQDNYGGGNFNLVNMTQKDRDDLAKIFEDRKDSVQRALTDRDGNILSMKDLNNQFTIYGIKRAKLTGITKQDKTNLLKDIKTLATKKDIDVIREGIEQDTRSANVTGSQEDISRQQSYEQEANNQQFTQTFGDSDVPSVTGQDFSQDAYDDPLMKQGGLLKKKPKVKKMKRGGLASR